tara:strand:+ start:104 stop:577 length:474 start_codon:yes stop_codon:yes gene_type:complete
MLANLIYLIHVFLIILIVTSSFFKPGEWLKYIIVLIPIVMLDWKDNDKQCSLTSLEAKIRGTWTPGNSDDKGAPEFFRPLLNKVLKPFGQEIKSRETAGRINNILFLSILLYNIIRYIQIQNKPIKPDTNIGIIYYYSVPLFLLLYIVDILYPVQNK